MKKYAVGAAMLTAASFFSGVARAESDFLQTIGLAGPWIVTVKGTVATSPKWDGSHINTLFGFPSMSLRRPNEKPVWSSPDESVGYNIRVNEMFSLGPVIAYRAGRYNTGDRDLDGIHDTDWTLEPGLFMQAWIVPNVLRARIEVRRGFRAKEGFVADMGADWVNTFGNLAVAVGPRMSLGDGPFMRNYYGVTELDAARNAGVTAYRANAGVKSVGVFASAAYRFNETWDATLFGGYNRLMGDAGDSPVVKRYGSRDQWTVGTTIGYSFSFAGF